jgi:UDP-GlcNAc3NAcA epimerase
MIIATIVGARPQFIKAAGVSRFIRQKHLEILVHTGQHYDYEMAGIFFEGLELPPPDYDLGVGSGPHGAQTGAMLEGIEKVLQSERPDMVVIYGDTNSTLAGALAAAKLNIPVAHVEAGLRSYNRRMPEEVNRVIADHLSALLLCPSLTAVSNLEAEGIKNNVHLVGDVMLEVLNWALARAEAKTPEVLAKYSLERRLFTLLTVHRSENTDDGQRLRGIVDAINALDEPVVFPIHPRTRKALARTSVKLASHILIIDPVGYLEMIALSRAARIIMTDSGGLQKEAYWLGVPCLTLRKETEWVETVENGWNMLVGTDPEKIRHVARSFVPPKKHPPLYGDGKMAAKCLDLLEQTSGD